MPRLIQFACLALAACQMTAPLHAVESSEVTLDYVLKKAEERASKPFHSPRLDLPPELLPDQLDYDKYREIQFRHDKALWLSDGLPFRAEFFHPGYLYQEPVHLHEFSSSHAQDIRFTRDFFNYGSLTLPHRIPTKTGYAGFRLLYPLQQPGRWDELGAFQGASYFRLLGRGQRYGQSARGLALDCGESGRPEEFPLFTDWWLGKPKPGDEEVHLFALLDSISCVGAYEFHIRPGEDTVADIEVVVLFRSPKLVRKAAQDHQPVNTVGFAPLTSMFWFGENSERKFDDYRPEVHDSDGLLIRQENGETLWRPLNNATVTRHQKFAARNVRGFGLLQRDRDFSHYQDLNNSYHLVPSTWVKPMGDWGEGDVHLVELSTQYEGLDNIVAFWSPTHPPAPMQPCRFSYRLAWTRETIQNLSPNRVISTRIGADKRDPKQREIVIDFAGPELDACPVSNPPVVVASCSDNASITDQRILRNTFAGSWRVVLKLSPAAENRNPVDIRCSLTKDGQNLSETWTYHWSPP